MHKIWLKQQIHGNKLRFDRNTNSAHASWPRTSALGQCHGVALSPEQTGRHFTDYISKIIFYKRRFLYSIQVLIKFLPVSPINNKSTLIQVMAWCIHKMIPAFIATGKIGDSLHDSLPLPNPYPHETINSTTFLLHCSSLSIFDANVKSINNQYTRIFGYTQVWENTHIPYKTGACSAVIIFISSTGFEALMILNMPMLIIS